MNFFSKVSLVIVILSSDMHVNYYCVYVLNGCDTSFILRFKDSNVFLFFS